MDKILFLVGPTASGKTDVSISLAKRIGAEIISCDSMQLYKGMDILSQKPTPRQRKTIPHHMIDTLPISKEFSAADYKKRVEEIIKDIKKRGRLPLVVGGSGLYVKALIDGLFPSEPKNAKLRKHLLLLSEKYGAGYLHKKLKRVDPDAADKIHPNNIRRVIRALEVYKTLKIPISKMKSKTKGLSSEYDIVIVGLRRQRQDLYNRVNKRVDNMFRAGLVSEVKSLRRKRIAQTARSILGFKEITSYLDGELTKNEVRELLKRNTRRFAKRQMTWFKKEARIIWIDVDRDDRKKTVLKKILKKIKR